MNDLTEWIIAFYEAQEELSNDEREILYRHLWDLWE